MQVQTQPAIEATTTAATTTTQATTAATTAQTTKAQATKKGDVNCDGKLTVSDAILLARIVAEDTSAKITDEGKLNGELDGVDGLSTNDTTELLKLIAGLK